jgi:hypothetical protein
MRARESRRDHSVSSAAISAQEAADTVYGIGAPDTHIEHRNLIKGDVSAIDAQDLGGEAKKDSAIFADAVCDLKSTRNLCSRSSKVQKRHMIRSRADGFLRCGVASRESRSLTTPVSSQSDH